MKLKHSPKATQREELFLGNVSVLQELCKFKIKKRCRFPGTTQQPATLSDSKDPNPSLQREQQVPEQALSRSRGARQAPHSTHGRTHRGPRAAPSPCLGHILTLAPLPAVTKGCEGALPAQGFEGVLVQEAVVLLHSADVEREQ